MLAAGSRAWRVADTSVLSGAGCVLGPPVTGFDPFALARTRATMAIDGPTVGASQGPDILGEPLVAPVWLADLAARRRAGLRQGWIVLLGSLVQTHWLAPGAEVPIADDLLGGARALPLSGDHGALHGPPLQPNPLDAYWRVNDLVQPALR